MTRKLKGESKIHQLPTCDQDFMGLMTGPSIQNGILSHQKRDVSDVDNVVA